MYLISAYFDEQSNKTIQRYINQVAKVTNNNFMMAHKVPPHLTISAIEARNVDTLIPAFESMRNLESGKITIPMTGQLLPYVMCINPVANRYLQDLSEEIFDTFKSIPETTISRYYQPYSWIPHITIGKKLDAEQMRQAFDIMQQRFSPMEAQIVSLGLAKVNPHEDVRRIELR